MLKTISTDKAPAAIGPYSQGKIYGDLVFLSGQIPLDPKSGEVAASDIAGQTACVLANVESLLEEAGSSFDNVIKTTCFLADMADFAEFNRLYAERFVSKPARSCVAVKALPKGVLVEIELIAVCK